MPSLLSYRILISQNLLDPVKCRTYLLSSVLEIENVTYAHSKKPTKLILSRFDLVPERPYWILQVVNFGFSGHSEF